MSDRIQNYLAGVNRHIFLFRASAIALNTKILQDDPSYFQFISADQIKKHDLTKFEEPELSGYANYFPEKLEVNKPAFLNAVKHHYIHNRHHPEYWQARQSVMPTKYITEMWADWMAASYQYSDTWDMSEWLNNSFKDGGKWCNTFNKHQILYIANIAQLCGYQIRNFDYRLLLSDGTFLYSEFLATDNLLIPNIEV